MHQISFTERIAVGAAAFAACFSGLSGAAGAAEPMSAEVGVEAASGAVAPQSVHFGRTTPICDGDDVQNSWTGLFSYIVFVRDVNGDFNGTLYTTEPKGGDSKPGNPTSNGSQTYKC